MFDALPSKYFITPVLHLTIGKGNNILDNYVAELQAAAEGYTDKYYAAKNAEVQTKIAQLQAKDQLAQFNMVMLEYEKDLNQQSKRNMLSDAD
jgi:NAD(P)H-hydrate repair Nnr-like enzyme with NAD(P)H-hydrate epimerase domain